jgi:hypothetical protein
MKRENNILTVAIIIMGICIFALGLQAHKLKVDIEELEQENENLVEMYEQEKAFREAAQNYGDEQLDIYLDVVEDKNEQLETLYSDLDDVIDLLYNYFSINQDGQQEFEQWLIDNHKDLYDRIISFEEANDET